MPSQIRARRKSIAADRIVGLTEDGVTTSIVTETTTPLVDEVQVFTDLEDVPGDYTGAAAKLVAVNATEDALEFVDPPAPAPEVSPVVHARYLSTSDDIVSFIPTPVSGDIVLVNASPPASVNGVWEYDGSAFNRWTTDETQMRLVHIMEDTYAGRLYELVTDGAVTIGTDAIEFAEILPGIADGAITTAKIADDAVTLAKLADDIPRAIACRAVCLANMDLSGTETQDGVNFTDGEYALCVAQTAASENGPWVVDAGAWTRPPNWAPFPGQMCSVAEGTLFADTVWHLTNNSAPVVGTDSQTWRRMAGPMTVQVVSAAVTISKFTWPRAYVGISGSTNPGFTITLPAAADYKGGTIVVKAQTNAISGTNPVVIARTGTDTIDGATTVTINAGWVRRHFISDGSNWYVTD